MPNGYTAGVVDGTATAADYLNSCARSRGFAIMQRDESLDAPVRYRKRSAYYDDSIKKARQELDEWLNMTSQETKQAYYEYVDRIRQSNKDSIAEAAIVLARIQAVRDAIVPLDWPDELHSMRDDALKMLDDTEAWDAKPYTSSIQPYDEWVAARGDYLRRSLGSSEKYAQEETERVEQANHYIDLFHKVLEQL
jgi:hypothetical protein